MAYIEIPVETTDAAIAEDAFDYIAQQVPGWLPSPANLEAWLIEANAQFAAELRALALLVPDAIFAYFGESILGLPSYQAIPATGMTTWVMIDAAGYTVDAGTLLALTPPASTDAFLFIVDAPFTVPAGSTTATDVQIVAMEPGSEASSLTGTVQVLDQLDFVSTVTLQGATSGGSDAETSAAYLDRLSDLLTLLSPRPILPPDFAVMAQRSIAGVARATAIDLYNPGPPVNANCPRCVTVVVADADGNPVPSQVKADTDALLQSQREVNFLVFVADPTYTTIDVAFTAKSYAGYDPADVNARVIARLRAYLSPVQWGVPTAGDPGSVSWINETTVRYLEVVTEVNNVDGVHYVQTLTLNVSGSAPGTADIVMPGAAPMPKPGAITGVTTADA